MESNDKLKTMNINKEMLMIIVRNSGGRLEGDQEILEINERQLHLIRTELTKLFFIHSVSKRYDVSKYTPPFRVGRKQGKAVLDATGREVIFFSDSEEQAKKYCDYLNGC